MQNSIFIEGYSDRLNRLISEGNLGQAIDLVCALAHQTVVSANHKGFALRLPELDAAIVQIADLMRPMFPAAFPARTEHVCLATEVYPTGGHRQIINSVCEEIPSHLVFTDLFGRIESRKVNLEGLITPKVLSSITLTSDGLVDKITSAVNFLHSLSPNKIWIFGHHQDIVAVLAAAIFDRGRRSVFVHHCDHDPALGATIKFPVHFDFTDECRRNCASFGLASTQLALYTPPARRRAAAPTTGFVVATSGSMNKFTHHNQGIHYKDVVRAVLQHPRVEAFHHIGEVDDQFANALRAFLLESGIPADRVKFSGQVHRVSDYLLFEGVNIYLSSFPFAGGLVTAEVQSAGIPVVYFDPIRNARPLTSIESIFASPELKWSTLESLSHALDSLLENWGCFSNAAQQKYFTTFSHEVFLGQLLTVR